MDKRSDRALQQSLRVFKASTHRIRAKVARAQKDQRGRGNGQPGSTIVGREHRNQHVGGNLNNRAHSLVRLDAHSRQDGRHGDHLEN